MYTHNAHLHGYTHTRSTAQLYTTVGRVLPVLPLFCHGYSRQIPQPSRLWVLLSKPHERSSLHSGRERPGRRRQPPACAADAPRQDAVPAAPGRGTRCRQPLAPRRAELRDRPPAPSPGAGGAGGAQKHPLPPSQTAHPGAGGWWGGRDPPGPPPARLPPYLADPRGAAGRLPRRLLPRRPLGLCPASTRLSPTRPSAVATGA